jgi:hypothetical protein
MVMIFRSKKALSYLLSYGEVYTFRIRRRKAGRDWITDKRGGHKIADVFIEEVGIFTLEQLSQFGDHSGFASVEEWTEEIQKLNNRLPEKGWLYKVRVV